MSINILLIIIIVLLVVGLLLQMLHLVALANLPTDLLNLLVAPFDLSSKEMDVIDVKPMKTEPKAKPRGVSKPKQTKRSKPKTGISGVKVATQETEETEVKTDTVE